MRKITLYSMIVFIFLFINKMNAQNDFRSADSRIVLSIALPEQAEPIPTEAQTFIVNKLKQGAAQNGLAAEEGFSRFVITAVITPMTRDIVVGPPRQIAQTLDVTLYIADAFDQKIFATTSISAKGMGIDENKSYMDAVRHVNTNTKQFKEFAEAGKARIIAYYEAQCDNIIKKAQSLANQKKYEEALFELTAIPDVCKCHDRALQATSEIYQQYIDYLCDVNLAQARTAWAAEQNAVGAEKAGKYLANIYPDAKCYNEAMSLYREIKGKVLDDWKFVMKMYEDGADLEKERIKAWREVGVAYGKHQQPVSNYVNWLLR